MYAEVLDDVAEVDDFAAHFSGGSGRFRAATAEVGEFGFPFLADACSKACDLGDVVTEAGSRHGKLGPAPSQRAACRHSKSALAVKTSLIV